MYMGLNVYFLCAVYTPYRTLHSIWLGMPVFNHLVGDLELYIHVRLHVCSCVCSTSRAESCVGYCLNRRREESKRGV